MSHPEIQALLKEVRVLPAVRGLADARPRPRRVRLRTAAADPEAFWAALRVRTRVDGAVDDRCSTGSRRTRRWFVGGKLNVSVNCLDRHVRTARRNKAAIIWEGEPGDRRTLTYFDLLPAGEPVRQRARSRSACRKGDRVALYMPLVPELAIAMLACARIGAVHSVVFGGFSADSLRDRINDAQCTVLVTADGGYRRGQIVPLKQMADEALKGTPSIRHVVVVQRAEGDSFPVHMKEGRDHWYHRLMQDAAPHCPPEADGCGGHALHPLHVRHDRKAEGHRPHDRRLPRRHLRHDASGCSI